MSGGLAVAVTGPTGEVGRAFLHAADRARSIGSVIGMARRPFDPAAYGLRKTRYVEGDVLDRAAVDALVAEADVVVHLAFIIMGGREKSHRINLEGSANVFEAAAAAPRVKRLVYTSSVAAYGFHAGHPQPLTEEAPPRDTEAHYYSAHKAELEATVRWATAGADLDSYVLRPCTVAGGDALLLLETLPWLLRRAPLPVLPDTGIPFQLVHHDDVATALVAAARGAGPPGIYNLAGPGELFPRDLARALGWRTVPVPRAAVTVAAAAAGLPLMPAQAVWLRAVRVPMLMDTTRARRKLGWRPRHNAAETLAEMAAAGRRRELV
jgi:UDP-glucose 4-epimerase